MDGSDVKMFSPPRGQPDAAKARCQRNRWVAIGVPTLVLAVSLLGVAEGWWSAHENLQRHIRERFSQQTQAVMIITARRLEHLEDYLEGFSGLYAASHSVERDEFKEYFSELNMTKDLPGVLGVYFAKWMPAAERDAFVAAVRVDTSRDPTGYPAFTIQPPGDRDVYAPVTYLEPLEGHERLLGFDVWSDPARQDALVRARDQDSVFLTSSLTLVFESAQTGFLAVVPVYRNKMPQATVEERRAAIDGFIVSLVAGQPFLADVLKEADLDPAIDLEVFDGVGLDGTTPVIIQEHRLFASHRAGAPDGRTPLLSRTMPFAFGGRTWVFRFKALPGFGLVGLERHFPLIVLGGGLVASLLLFGIALALATSRSRAVMLAAQMTVALRRQAETTIQTNAELTHQQGVMQSLLGDLQTSKENLESQQRRLEQSLRELQEAQLQLIQAAKMESVGRLAAGVAHEVKNPLAILLMGTEYLAQHVTNGDEKAQGILRDMTHAVKRADTVIKGLLDFSVSRELQLAEESLSTVIEQALLLVKHELTRQRVTAVTQLSPEVPRLPLDRQKIEQVLINLLMNAIHAMPEGGTLTVRTAVRRPASPSSKDEPAVVVDIEDTGTGIPDDSLAKIFDPFFTTKPIGQGTGLGLTVAKKIVELHHGTIEIRNRPEGGARATVRLPLGGRA